MAATDRDQQLAETAKAHGAQYSLRIVWEARRAGIPISLGFALVEQETGFRNVWGHDPAPNGGTSQLGGSKVTKAAYLAYRKRRGARGRGGMQGVGPCQLTWYAYQDKADQFGGCWVAKHNIRVAFELLAAQMRAHGTRAGIRSYNGSGTSADRYAQQVLDRQRKWHRILTGGNA
jgi:hypothetical protein